MTRKRFVSFRVHPNELDDINVVARYRGISRSKLLRQLVHEEKKRIAEGLEEKQQEEFSDDALPC